MSEDLEIRTQKSGAVWEWTLIEYIGCSTWMHSFGTSPDYDEACRMAKIAWEQHSEDKP